MIFVKRTDNCTVASYLSNRTLGVVIKDIANGARSLDSIPGQVKSDKAFLRSCVVQALSRGDGPASHYMLPRKAASIMKIWF